MQQSAVNGSSHAALRPATTTLMEVVRAHGLGELRQKDEPTLRRYQAFLREKIAQHEQTLRTNILKGFAVDIREDLRYFQSIEDVISTLLTAAFNAK